MIIGITGHRKINNVEKCSKAIEKALENLEAKTLISGMALGVDQIAVNVCLKNKISYIAAIPFEDQEKYWSEKEKNIYKDLVALAKQVVYVSPPGFAKYKYQKRNEWIVKNSDCLIAVYDGSFSGTKNCFDFALKNNKKIYWMNPDKDFDIKMLNW